MKFIRFFFALVLTTVFFSYMNYKRDEIPPLAKFMNPYRGFWQNSELEEIQIKNDKKFKELKEQVNIKYDKQSIPHIKAQNDYDVFFAQGYLTAIDRLWQMDFQVLATEGRISELIRGKKILDFDREQRRKGLKYAAKRSLEEAKDDKVFMNMLQAYSDGVNAYIDQLQYKNYPIEYKILDYSPEKWSPYRSMLLLKYMADMLSSWEADFENTNALNLFGREDFDMLFPDNLKRIDPVIPTGTNWDFTPMNVNKPENIYQNTFKKEKDLIDKVDPQNGSNNFVVGPSRTMNGTVVFANETDLSLNLPCIWYLNQLTTPDMNVFGSSLPGAPGVITGFNDSIAWGVTNAKRDVVDWYKIEFRNPDRKEYKYDDKWLKTETVIERFEVRDGSPFYDTIVHTHYGPVVYDRNYKNESHQSGYAMKWTAHEESKELMTFYELNRANNYDDFVKALRHFVAPAQNFAFGSANGDIGMWVNGRFPLKWEEQGKFVMDGANSDYEWGQDIPHEHKVSIKNPTQGFLSSANQHPVDSLYPYYVYDYNYEMYRNRRINDRLKYLAQFTVKDAMKLQNDNYNFRASESLPLMLDLLDTAALNVSETKAYSTLRKWDYFNEPKREAPSIYEAWWNTLYHKIWDEFDRDDIALKKPYIYNTIRLMKEDSVNKYFDIKETNKVEVLEDLVNQSYKNAMKELETYKDKEGSIEWYKYKGTKITHLLDIDPFSVKDVPVGGNRNIVNAVSKNHGPSFRMVVELSKDGVKGWGVYPGSQTGNPGNLAYANLVQDWAKGHYFQINFLNKEWTSNKNIVKSITFKKD
ncbi:penicillin acylase family protein [Reichenbachiella versicolor]|uniref:penicillin acylase family protein n=1 Tax=Reichenbachiella versicolor TaxID=1821036 RepID=UPI000D6DF107|nr:penicillin acylase family protein [Reichenbachiella versicolor]